MTTTTTTTTTATKQNRGPVRLFVPTLRARELDAATKEALTAKVLTAAQAHNARFAVISSRDLKAVLDVEAERIAAGCDDDGCTSEVAEALDAPQVLVATLDHVGDRWLLTIARADRASVRVLVQATRDVRGETPEPLLDVIPGLVDEVLGVPSSPLVVGGAVTTGVGATLALVGLVPLALAWTAYGDAEQHIDDDDDAAARSAIDDGKRDVVGAQVLWGVGAAIAIVGGAVAVVGLATASDAESP